MSNARLLLKLQETDQEIETAKASIAKLSAKLGPTPELNQARIRAEEAERRLERGRKAQQEHEWMLQELNQKLASSQKRLYDGTVTHPRELQALHEEVAHLTRRVDQTQDRILEALLEIEEAKEALDGARAQLAQIEAQWESEQKEIQQELQQWQSRLARLTETRREIESQLKPAELELYADLRRRKGPNPVARLRGQTCRACGIALPVATAHQARDEEELTFCPSCGRLLVAE